MTERERRALLPRRPTVTFWQRLLETARNTHERQQPPADRLDQDGMRTRTTAPGTNHPDRTLPPHRVGDLCGDTEKNVALLQGIRFVRALR